MLFGILDFFASKFFNAADTYPSRFFYVLDLFGTMSFAFSGAIRVIDKSPDIIGMLILASATAIGGAVLRDAILSRPVIVMTDPMYLVMILLAVIITFMFPSLLCKNEKVFQYFDAIGLGVFSGVTASVAWGVYQMNPISVMFIACFGGCAGGVVRDLVIQKSTVILSNEIVVTPVILGAISLMVIESLGCGEIAGFLVAVLVCVTLRVIAILTDLRLPRILQVEKSHYTKKPKDKKRRR